MSRLLKVHADEFDRIYGAFLRELNSEIPKGVWQRLFNYRWNRPEDYIGFKLLDDDGDDPIGFLGLIFSEMTIAGRTERLCNVTSWVAREGYTAQSALLVFALREMKNYTITNLSCNEVAFRVFSRVGFRTLETHKRVLPPVPGLVGVLRTPEYHTIFDVESIWAEIDSLDRKVLEDHIPYAKSMLIADKDGYCLILYTLGKRRGLGTARVHYVSCAERFRKYLRNIQGNLLLKHGSPFLECDERFLQGMRVSMSYKTNVFRVFQSSSLEKEQIPNLYSELVLLNI